MHFFTSEKLISLFVVCEILLPCCLTDDSGSGARGGGISGCEGNLPGEILTTGMFISTFCGLSVLFKSTGIYLERLTDPILRHWRPSEVWRPVSLSEWVLPVESSQLAAVLVHLPGLEFSPSKRLQSQDPFFCFYAPDVLLGDISHLALKGSADLVILWRFNTITGLHNYFKNFIEVFSRFNTWICIKRQKLQLHLKF